MRVEGRVVVFTSACALVVALGLADGPRGASFGGSSGPIVPPPSTSASVAVPTTSSTLAPEPRTISVAAVGDWLSERAVNNAAANLAAPGVRYDHAPLLEPLVPLLDDVDLAICHMETPIGRPDAHVGEVSNLNGFTQFVAPYEVAADLRRVGFDRCSTASNHSMDLGADGIESTLDALDAAGIAHSGTERTATEAAPSVFEVNGVKVAHIAATIGSDMGWPKQTWRLNQSVPGNVVKQVDAARAAGAELVVFSLHIRAAGGSAPRAAERAHIEEITSQADIDLVVIHGPHTIQPVETVNGTIVYWSLGNLISGMGEGDGPASDRRRLDGLMALVQFTERPDGGWLADVSTVLLCNLAGSRVVYPGLTTLADPTIDTSLREALTYCVNRSSRVVDDLE